MSGPTGSRPDTVAAGRTWPTRSISVRTHDRIRTLITLARVVCVDETPLKVGPRTPRPGKICCAHLLRDLDDAAQVYPDAVWPTQISGALRELIHQANLARDAGLDQIDPAVRDKLISRFHHGVLVGLSDTLGEGTRPGERKARLLLQVLRDRQSDVLRFAHDLAVPPTSNQAERDLRPAKCQQNVSGRLPSEDRTRDRYTIRGFVSTAIKHGLNPMTALRDMLLGALGRLRCGSACH
jgi:transposase